MGNKKIKPTEDFYNFLPKRLQESTKLSVSEKNVLAALCFERIEHRDYAAEHEGWYYCSHNDLIVRTMLSKAQLNRRLLDLEIKGIIQRKSGTKHRCTHYKLHPKIDELLPKDELLTTSDESLLELAKQSKMFREHFKNKKNKFTIVNLYSNVETIDTTELSFHPNGQCGCIELDDDNLLGIRCNHWMWAEGTCEGIENFWKDCDRDFWYFHTEFVKEPYQAIMFYGNHKGTLVIKLLVLHNSKKDVEDAISTIHLTTPYGDD